AGRHIGGAVLLAVDGLVRLVRGDNHRTESDRDGAGSVERDRGLARSRRVAYTGDHRSTDAGAKNTVAVVRKVALGGNRARNVDHALRTVAGVRDRVLEKSEGLLHLDSAGRDALNLAVGQV